MPTDEWIDELWKKSCDEDIGEENWDKYLADAAYEKGESDTLKKFRALDEGYIDTYAGNIAFRSAVRNLVAEGLTLLRGEMPEEL